MKHHFHSFLIVSMTLALIVPVMTGCSTRKSDPTTEAETDTLPLPAPTSADTLDIARDSSSAAQVSSSKPHSTPSSPKEGVDRYYDEGYREGYNDGFEDGVENSRYQSYDNNCNFKVHSQILQYEDGYQEGYDDGYDDGFADSDITPRDDFEE